MIFNLKCRGLTEIPWSKIPEDVTILYLRNNSLTRLPPEIGRLTKLTILDLRNNQLTSLPSEIGQLTKLTRLDLRDNPLKVLPDSVVINPGEEPYYTGFIRLPKWNHSVNVVI